MELDVTMFPRYISP